MYVCNLFKVIIQINKEGLKMIPDNISRDDILKAMAKINEFSVPRNRESTIYHVAHNGRLYPPKYLLSLANKYANGCELKPSEFSGGKESNNYLRALKFEIRTKT